MTYRPKGAIIFTSVATMQLGSSVCRGRAKYFGLREGGKIFSQRARGGPEFFSLDQRGGREFVFQFPIIS